MYISYICIKFSLEIGMPLKALIICYICVATNKALSLGLSLAFSGLSLDFEGLHWIHYCAYVLLKPHVNIHASEDPVPIYESMADHVLCQYDTIYDTRNQCNLAAL